MKSKITLSLLALCCVGGIAQAQNDFPFGIHVGSQAADGSPKLIMFGDTGAATSVFLGELLVNDTMVLNAARFHFQNGNVGIGTATPQAKLDVRGPALFQNGNSYRGAIVNIQASQANETGGGIAIGDDGGFFDYNDGYVTYKNLDSTGGLKVDAKFTVTGNAGIGGDMTVQGQVRATTLLLTSDRNAKSNFRAVDDREVLKKLAALPITTWDYTNAPGVRHLGPMAQDFKAAFKLGEDDKHIATVDVDGVALASIQALYEMVQEKDSEIAALKRQISALKTDLAAVKDHVADRLAALEKATSRNNLQQASLRTEALR